jgi:hypothetical protein
VDFVRASMRQWPMRPLQGESRVGERCRRDEASARPSDDVRVGRRHRFDEPSVGPSNVPQGEVGGILEDFRRLLEVVL